MPKRTLILGTGALALSLANEIANHRRNRLIGVVGEDTYSSGEGFPCRYLGSMAGLRAIVEGLTANRIILALEEKQEHLPADLLIESQISRHIAIEAGVKALEDLTGKLAIGSYQGSSMLFSGDFGPRPLGSALCRAISIAVAAVGLVLCLPLMAAIAVAIRLDSPGPILFVQERIGRGGKRFKFLKFRSMFHTGKKRSEWARDNFNEITRVGRLIRKFRMDELLQFINVLYGDMNIVGPRPHPASNRELFVLAARNVAHCGEAIPYYSLRQTVRPGITGWAQVSYKYANGLDEEIEKLQYDLYYIKHYSPILDIKILFKTIGVILGGQAEKGESTQAGWTAAGEMPGSVRPGQKPLRSSGVSYGMVQGDKPGQEKIPSPYRSDMQADSVDDLVAVPKGRRT